MRLTANTVVTGPGMVGPVALMAGDELPGWADGMVGEHLLVESVPVVVDAAAPVVPAVITPPVPDPTPEPEPAPDESWTVEDLKAHAKEHDVDLSGARSKADILAAIEA